MKDITKLKDLYNLLYVDELDVKGKQNIVDLFSNLIDENEKLIKNNNRLSYQLENSEKTNKELLLNSQKQENEENEENEEKTYILTLDELDEYIVKEMNDNEE